MDAEIAFGSGRRAAAQHSPQSNSIPSPTPPIASAVALRCLHLCSRVLSSRLLQSTSRSLFHIVCFTSPRAPTLLRK